jgi:hypothetical protein
MFCSQILRDRVKIQALFSNNIKYVWMTYSQLNNTNGRLNYVNAHCYFIIVRYRLVLTGVTMKLYETINLQILFKRWIVLLRRNVVL